MKIISFEGVDGCGKSTQTRLLSQYFDEEGIKYKAVHFPDYTSDTGRKIASFLRGDIELSNDEQIVLFSQNRKKYFDNTDLSDIEYLIADRYVYSSAVYQTIEGDQTLHHKESINNILNINYDIYNVPKPFKTFYLKQPFSFIEQNVKNRLNTDREYLCGGEDKYESNLFFLEKIYNLYEILGEENKDIQVIECQGKNPLQINVDIISQL